MIILKLIGLIWFLVFLGIIINVFKSSNKKGTYRSNNRPTYSNNTIKSGLASASMTTFSSNNVANISDSSDVVESFMPTTNPTTGMPMLNSGIDVQGTPFGMNDDKLSLDENTFDSFAMNDSMSHFDNDDKFM